jgi:hypothetical protein
MINPESKMMIQLKMILKEIIMLILFLLMSFSLFGQGVYSDPDSLFCGKIHRLDFETRYGYVLPTHIFLKGENEARSPIENMKSLHLRYGFKFSPNCNINKIYNGVYQGIGASYFDFGNKKELGSPVSVYLFQGARIGKIDPVLSINYEWNLGLSMDWKPYDFDNNSYNKIIGSKVNAYIDAGLYLNWILSENFDLTTGINFTHFSNGHTEFPNAGLNALGIKAGLVYNFKGNYDKLKRLTYLPYTPFFQKHWSYDLLLFGSWRRKAVNIGEDRIASPYYYEVLGFNFSPMYNVDYKYRLGLSLDGVYDGSANVYTLPFIEGNEPDFYKSALRDRLSLGVSGRAELVMPYFSVGLGLGVNFLGRGDLKAFYQIISLKINLSRNLFLNVGYSLHDFQTPNHLMLGIGFSFNNKYPRLKH